MSDYETHFGKLQKIEFKIKSIPFKNKIIILESLGYKLDYDEDDGEDGYFESEELHYCKELDEFYSFKEHKQVDTDFAEMSENANGTLNFACNFYNGGGGFNEMLDEMLITQDKKSSKQKGYKYEA